MDIKTKIFDQVAAARTGQKTVNDATNEILRLMAEAQSHNSDITDPHIQDIIRETFYAGFDEGYTNPLERNGEIITEEEYEAERKRNFQDYLESLLNSENMGSKENKTYHNSIPGHPCDDH